MRYRYEGSEMAFRPHWAGFRLPALMILAALALAATNITAAQATTRTLSFPAGAPLGRLIAIDPGEPRLSTEWQWGWDRIGKPLGDARGEVKVPAGTHLALALDSKAGGALGALSGLPGGALEKVVGYDLPLSDAVLAALGRLKPPTGIYLHQQNVSDADLARLAGLGALKGLRVSKGGRITSATLAALGRLKGVEQLFLEWGAVDSRGLFYLAQLPVLRRLELQNVSTGEGLRDLAEFPALEQLTIRNLDSLGLGDLLLPTTCKSLNLTGFGNYPEEDFACIERFSELETLTTSYLIDDDCAAHLTALKSLKRLSLSYGLDAHPGDRRLSDAAAAHLAGIKTLESVGLAYGRYSDRALESLATLPRLKSLGIVNYAGFTETGLASLKGASALEDLRLLDSGPVKMTDKALLALAELPKLKKLYMWDRGQITDAALARLRQLRPGLTVEIDREMWRQRAKEAKAKREAKTGKLSNR